MEREGGLHRQARVEGSDDSKYWSSVVGHAPLLYLEHAGARLERSRIDMNGARAKYLRVSFSNVPADFVVKQIRVELRADKSEPEREWLTLPGREGKPGEVLFDTEGRFPVDRARPALPQPNTVAQVQLLTRERSEDAWRSVAAATVYRLNRDGGRTAQRRYPLPGQRRPLLAAARRAEGRRPRRRRSCGSRSAGCRTRWCSSRAARRHSRSATAAKLAKSGALPVATVFPGYPERDITTAGIAKIWRHRRQGRASPRSPIQAATCVVQSIPARRSAGCCWSALIIGVLIVIWMAFRLLRDLGNTNQG